MQSMQRAPPDNADGKSHSDPLAWKNDRETSFRNEAELPDVSRTVDVKVPFVQCKYFANHLLFGAADNRSISKIHWQIAVFEHQFAQSRHVIFRQLNDGNFSIDKSPRSFVSMKIIP